MSMTDTETPFGVGWYGRDNSIAHTGYIFRNAEDAARFARDGAVAPNFWLWVNEQPFEIDALSDGNDLPIVRADVETGEHPAGGLAEYDAMPVWGLNEGPVWLDNETKRYQRLEFTVGVMVPFQWDESRAEYVLVFNEVEETVGGLFSDAEEGPWVPEENEWMGCDTQEMVNASLDAVRYVKEGLGVRSRP